MNPRALILDFDGLMVDTEKTEYLAWKEIYEGEGAHLAVGDWLNAVGYVNGFDPRAHLEKLTARTLDWQSLDARRRLRVHDINAALEPLPGVRTVIAESARAGYRLGLASNSTADWVLPGLARLGLRDAFSVIKTVETVARPKPAPDVYLAVLADLGVNPADGCALEDSEPGVRAAKAAGLYVVAVPNGLTRHQDLSMADEIRDSLEGFQVAALPIWNL